MQNLTAVISEIEASVQQYFRLEALLLQEAGYILHFASPNSPLKDAAEQVRQNLDALLLEIQDLKSDAGRPVFPRHTNHLLRLHLHELRETIDMALERLNYERKSRDLP